MAGLVMGSGRRSRTVPVAVALGVLLVPAAGAVAGQVLPRPDTAAPGRDTISTRRDTLRAIPLAPVRVTVLRAPLGLVRVPRSVTVESPSSPAAGLTLADALGAAPGVQVDARYNFSQGDRISVRGFGARAPFGVRGVKVLVDGIPATMPDGQTSLSHVDPWRIERAEVVRGPASSLYGNASGGVIQLETVAPRRPGPAVSARSMMGAHGLWRHAVTAGWSVRDPRAEPGRVRVGAAASRLDWDGFREHASATKTFGSADATWAKGGSELAAVAHGVTYTAANPGSLSAELLEADRTQANPFNVTQATGESADQLQVGVRWRRRLSAGTAAFPDPDADGPAGPGGPDASGGAPELELAVWALGRRVDNPIPPAIIDLDRVAGGVRVQARGQARVAGRSVRWVAGLDAEAQRDDRRNHENDGGERGALTLDQRERVEAMAPFLELATRVAGPVRATAGLRLDRHRFSADDRLVAEGDPNDSGSRRMRQLSPSAGLLVELPRGAVFATLASAFETPTTTELVNRPSGGAGLNPELDPQRAWTLEAGARFRPTARIRVEWAAFQAWIRDALIPYEVPAAPGRSFFRNAGEARHRGLEMDVRAELGTGLRGRLTYAWLDARFDRFATESGDHGGNRVPGVADHRLRASLSWRPARGGAVELSARYVGEVPVDDGNTGSASPYAVWDVRATLPGVDLGGAALQVFVGIDNLLDRAYVASVVVNAFGGRYFEPGPGRSAFFGLRARLGR